MPVEVRSASACSALFTSPVDAARGLLSHTGLEPVRTVRGRALCSLAFVRYTDGDLGPYHEFALALLARLPGERKSVGAYIHWLPVNQGFTLQAGRSIWGFPKELADIDIRFTGRAHVCVVRKDGQLVLALRVRRGLPVPPGTGGTSVDAYTHQDGVLRRTPWRMRPARVRARPGGARLLLGDHPAADPLRALRLSRSALTTSEIGILRMTFDDAREIG
ncbi:Acetoacetate decarboxylase (ADC) [Amycolatopsis marina]|uniref:Acetoacetate decarboxylase (ADC) n=2 Tax=Amycolatopsis marina TaxID=490629 RepID=A0A1I1AYR7_9PSEU|nr:Acetoacetate decarboxylase (ADC) [Amycolatopsis marina]